MGLVLPSRFDVNGFWYGSSGGGLGDTFPGLPKGGTANNPVAGGANTAGGIADVGNAACQLISNPVARAACVYAAGTVGNLLDRGLAGKNTPKSGNTGNPLTTQVPTTTKCPPGTVRVGNTCVSPGDVFPGGDPFTFPAGGTMSMGAMGMPAVTPAQMQQTTLRCPPRYALGLDNLCYPKPLLPKNLRKWRPAPRPLLSAQDAKILNRAKSVQGKLRRVAGKHVPKPRSCGCSKGGKKK